MWRGADVARGYPVGHPGLPARRARPRPALPGPPVDGRRGLGHPRRGRRDGVAGGPGGGRPAPPVERAQGLGRLRRLRGLRHGRRGLPRGLGRALASRARRPALAAHDRCRLRPRPRLRPRRVAPHDARRQRDGAPRGGPRPAALRRRRSGVSSSATRASPSRVAVGLAANAAIALPGLPRAVDRRRGRGLGGRHRDRDHRRPRAARPRADDRVLRPRHRGHEARLPHEGRARDRAGEGRGPRLAERLGQRRRPGLPGRARRHGPAGPARPARPRLRGRGGHRRRRHLLLRGGQGLRSPDLPHHLAAAGAAGHRRGGQPRGHGGRLPRRARRGRDRRPGRPLRLARRPPRGGRGPPRQPRRERPRHGGRASRLDGQQPAERRQHRHRRPHSRS